MPRTLLALFAGCGLAVQQAPAVTIFGGTTDFEEITTSDAYFNPSDVSGYAEIAQDETVLDYSGSRPAHGPWSTSGDKVLAVDASEYFERDLMENEASSAPIDGGIYIDMLVKGTSLNVDAGTPEIQDGDKLMLYFGKVESSGAVATNLFVIAGDGNNGSQKYALVTPSGVEIADDVWNRLVVVAKKDGATSSKFSVYLGGYDAAHLCATSGGVSEFPSISGDANIAAVAFKGTGYIDELVLSDIAPDANVATLTWPTDLTDVKYVVNGVTNDLTVANKTASFAVANGDVYELIGTFGGVTVAVSATASGSDIDLALPSCDLGWFFPTTAEEDGSAEKPFQIATYDDLVKLQSAVDVGYGRDKCYEQVADIALEAAWPGIGIKDGKDNVATAEFDNGAFTGTYDGGNYTISNFQMVDGLDYCGLFNSVYGATIKNLKVSYKDGSFAKDMVAANEACGATFVGVAKESTLQNLTSLAGTVSCTKGFGGIVGYLMAGSTVDSCTNNVNLTSTASNKAGGIVMITQGGSGSAVIRNCQNNGTTTGNPSQKGGIVGYVGVATMIENCEDTAGSNPSFLHNQGQTVTVQGVNKAPSNVTSYTTSNNKPIDGLAFATVENDVATFVKVADFAAGNTYKAMGPNATATYEFTALGSISFDEALYTPTYAITASGAAGIPTATTEGTVTTYTAGYFPRTATAGQDGSAEHPFEIADEDDLEALQAAVAAGVGADLNYVQTADIALTAAWQGIGVKGGKDIVSQPSYDTGAFRGVYDGGNFTISGFQMENGTDYGALFNSVYQATIKNLKMSYKEDKLCANSSSSGADTGATFVGVAKESTLQNLTALAGSVTAVSASKDMGGIVGYLMAGSTVDSCTNELNVASLKNTGRKCGGIAIITQSGTGTAVIRNCKNSGTVTSANKGAIVGYIGVATLIDGCENTAAVQMFHFQSASVTVSGTNKGNATVASNDKSGGVDGLFFATVSGDEATFVRNADLAAGETYKVMSAGATATYEFSAAGTISFDEALYTPTYAITAVEGVTLTDATEGTVKTYTASASTPAVEPTPVDPGTSLTQEDLDGGIAPAAVTADGFVVNFRGQAGVTYALVSTTDLSVAGEWWTNAAEIDAKPCAEDGALVTLTDSAAGEANAKFYKVKAYATPAN